MACYGPFFGKNQFSPSDEAVLMGLVVRKCHFDVNVYPAGARRLGVYISLTVVDDDDDDLICADDFELCIALKQLLILNFCFVPVMSC